MLSTVQMFSSTTDFRRASQVCNVRKQNPPQNIPTFSAFAQKKEKEVFLKRGGGGSGRVIMEAFVCLVEPSRSEILYERLYQTHKCFTYYPPRNLFIKLKILKIKSSIFPISGYG